MKLELFKDFLKENGISFAENEPMATHTSFKIGGNADIMINIENKSQIPVVIAAAKRFETECFILGKGSNLLVSDKGIRGAVINLGELEGVETKGNIITALAGTHLSRVCTVALENGLCGMEFAYGIPGSVGGAVYMNAGAYGGEISHVIKGAYCLLDDGSISYIPADEMSLGYRTSIFKQNGAVIISAEFKLKYGKKERIKADMDDYISRRKAKQPLEYPSAGSVFKRPQNHYAGALIERNGLKGTSCGGAQVSEKHAGFIINKGTATCSDVLNLIDNIKKTVLKNDGVVLEEELVFVGE